MGDPPSLAGELATTAGIAAYDRRQRERQLALVLDLIADKGCSVRRACILAKVKADVFYERIKIDEQYRTRYRLAREHFIQCLEDEARDRAVDGVVENVRYKGEVVGQKTRKSDAMLMFLLEANRPRKYRNQHGGAGRGGQGQAPHDPLGIPDDLTPAEILSDFVDIFGAEAFAGELIEGTAERIDDEPAPAAAAAPAEPSDEPGGTATPAT